MDANYFLTCRLDRIAQFYELGSMPFRETMRKIEDEEHPFEPPYSEDGEPPFELEYAQANDSVALFGALSISLLAGALQVFLDTLVKLYGSPVDLRKISSSEGWWGKHQSYFRGQGLDFATSGANLALISEIVLARNSAMHQESLTAGRVAYRDSDLEKIKNPFFISEMEKDLLESFGDGQTQSFLAAPSIHVDQEKLVAALSEVRLLAGWLEAAIWRATEESR